MLRARTLRLYHIQFLVSLNPLICRGLLLGALEDDFACGRRRGRGGPVRRGGFGKTQWLPVDQRARTVLNPASLDRPPKIPPPRGGRMGLDPQPLLRDLVPTIIGLLQPGLTPATRKGTSERIRGQDTARQGTPIGLADLFASSPPLAWAASLPAPAEPGKQARDRRQATLLSWEGRDQPPLAQLTVIAGSGAGHGGGCLELLLALPALIFLLQLLAPSGEVLVARDRGVHPPPLDHHPGTPRS